MAVVAGNPPLRVQLPHKLVLRMTFYRVLFGVPVFSPSLFCEWAFLSSPLFSSFVPCLLLLPFSPFVLRLFLHSFLSSSFSSLLSLCVFLFFHFLFCVCVCVCGSISSLPLLLSFRFSLHDLIILTCCAEGRKLYDGCR